MNNRSFIQDRIPGLICLLILISPALDVLSYWINYFSFSNALTLGMRLAVLMILLVLGFYLAPSKKPYLIMGGVLLLLTAGHVAACMQVGYAEPMGDLTNLLRIYILPLTTLCFMTFLQAFPEYSQKFSGCFVCCLLAIAAVELLSTITGTDPHTYPNKAIGVLGWFYYANSQSAILVMLVPISIFSVSRKSIPGAMVISILGLSMLYLFATRLAYLGLILTGLGLGIAFWFSEKSARPLAALLLVLTVGFAALLPLSPMVKNQTLVAENAVKKQQLMDELIAEDEAKARADGLTEEEVAVERLRSAYMEYLPGLVDTFGLERTAEAYGYSERASDIADFRRAKITYSKMLLEDSPALSAVFGMELSRWRYQTMTYDVENDFHGVFFLCGAVGLALLLIFLMYFVLSLLLQLIKCPKALLEPELMSLCIACISCAAHIYATSGVLRRPNVSFYLAICLALVWEYTRKLHRNDKKIEKAP